MDEPQNGPTQRSFNIDARSSTIHQLVGNQHNHNDEIHYHVTSTQQIDPHVLEKLRPADMDPYGRSQCLEGTRTGVVQNIIEWALDPEAVQKVIWLYGLAGAGKSTISTTIANRFDSMGHLSAFLFFDRDVAERSDPASVIRTLAYQASLSIPPLGRAIASSLEKYPRISMSPPSLQFQRLLVEPLASIYGGELPGPLAIVFVLDALDECGTPTTRQPLLQILAESAASLPANVRFIVTSRPERDLDIAFRTRPHVSPLELDITLDDNMSDVSAYLHHELASVRKKTPQLKTRANWPTEAETRKLVKRASGLFVWASTAIRFVDGYTPQKRLEVLLSGNTVNGAEHALDELYRIALEAAGNWDDEDFISDFRAVLGLILTLRQPLSSTCMGRLLALDDSSFIHIISHLGCVIQRNPTVRLLHPSFGDFLRTPPRNLRDIWSFDSPDHNIITTVNTLRHLRRKLKRNLCNMSLSTNSDGEKLSDDLTYASLFWVNHVCAIENNASVIMEDLSAFLFVHLLHWFEAMSILKRTRSTITMLVDLHNWLSTQSPLSLHIIELTSDAVKFAQTFVNTLEEHPLLVYHSALPFTPHSSVIYKAFNANISNYVVSCGSQQSWPSYSLILTGHNDSVISAVFSPDGRSIVSSSLDGTILMCDASTGAELFPPFYSGDIQVRDYGGMYYVSLSFSGLRILSVSSYGLLRMWDAISGVEFLPSLQIDVINKSRPIYSGAFSADGMKFVWGTNDGYIRVMHLSPYAQPRQLSAFYGRDLTIFSVSFSPDGRRIVSGFEDGSIRVYDAGSGLEIISTMRGERRKVRSVSFSPNGMRIVSALEHAHTRVWSVESGLEILSFGGDHYETTSVIFSPDGTMILSGSTDGTILVWDAISGVEIQDSLRYHNNSINSLAFSSDGRTIISASDDFTARMWKMSTDPSESIDPHSRKDREEICCVALSPDGSTVVSGSASGTISIWDAKSGTEIIPSLRNQDGAVVSIIFSPDETRIFSSCETGTIYAYEIITGHSVFPAIRNKLHYHTVRSIAICPLGNLIVSGDDKGGIRKWDAKLGVEIRFSEMLPAGRDRHIVLSVVFSSDGANIASASYYHTIIWDAHSGAMLIRIKSSSTINSFQHMAFSQDGSIIYRLIENHFHMWSITATEDTYGEEVNSDLDLCSRLSSRIVVTKKGWLVDPKTMRTFSQLPSSIRSQSLVFDCNSESLVIGTPDGHIYVMHFPSEGLWSPETRPMERNSWLAIINHEASYPVERNYYSD